MYLAYKTTSYKTLVLDQLHYLLIMSVFAEVNPTAMGEKPEIGSTCPFHLMLEKSLYYEYESDRIHSQII